MKTKRIWIFLSLAFAACFAAGLLAACTGDGGHEEPPVKQKGITWSGVEDVTIARGDNFDLLAGVTAEDGIEGDITENIIVKDDGDFDSEFTGRYTVEYEVMTSAGDVSEAKREISVQVQHNVANGKFNMPSRVWQFDVPGGNGSSKIVDEEQTFTITNPGNQWWSIQFYQLYVYLVRGETYRLSFDARSPEGHSVSAGFEEVNNNNRMMQGGVKVMKLTEEMQHYELTYTSDADVMNTKVVIYLGWQLPTDDATVSAPHHVIIDNVYVEKLDVKADAPVFSGIDPVTVVSGKHSFDAKEGVSAKDADGKALEFEATGVIPATVKKGCGYLVEYRAADAQGRETSVLRRVEFVMGTEYPYQLFNDDFSLGFTGWTCEINQVAGTGKAEYFEDKENGTVSIKVLDPSEADHHIQLFQDTPKFKKGESYRVTVVAKASQARNIKLEVTDVSNDYANIAKPLIASLTTEFQTFIIDFTVTDDFNRVKVAALLGTDGSVGKDVTVTFDRFSIEKVNA